MQAPDFAQRPSMGGGAATACPASSLSTQAPRSHKQRPRTQHGRWGCHRLSCVHHASPRFRATTQHGRWGCHRLSCILTVHARPPDLASNDPGPSSPTARLASTSTQAPDFAQRPSTGGGAATACPASSLSTQGPPISRATTQHERWGCHRPSFILHVSCPFRTPLPLSYPRLGGDGRWDFHHLSVHILLTLAPSYRFAPIDWVVEHPPAPSCPLLLMSMLRLVYITSYDGWWLLHHPFHILHVAWGPLWPPFVDYILSKNKIK
jgi:hypothetical protein